MNPIAFIAGSYQPNQCGVAHYTAHLREQLANRGMPSLVLTTHSIAQSNQNATVQGAVNGWHLRDLIPLVRAIHRSHASLLHIQHAAGTYGFDRALFLLPLLLRQTGWQAPIVTTVHEYGWWEWQPKGIPPQWMEWLKVFGQKRGWWDREDGFLLTQSHALITTTHEIEQTIFDRLPHLKSQVYRIPIAANVEVQNCDRLQARKTIRHQLGWSEDAVIIAFFGFLHPVKGLETLLPAFEQVCSHHPQARLLLIGGVETLALPGEQATRYWKQLGSRITELGLSSVVHRTGYLDAKDVSIHLTASDLGVLPFNHGVTLKSGSLLTLLAHALPTIATQSTPPAPQLDDTIGQWIPPRQVDSLASALLKVLTDSARRQTLASAGLHFSQQFTWDSIVEAHLAVYQSVGYARP
ncbi:glycosyltransferase family 4 protein [Egbenema bharatensis]|uniref:glycosyltransferase family 4 protein n=1 Tax=Egbenema bharatensis TaxID=3463334 RepID=UPI003A8ABDDC